MQSGMPRFSGGKTTICSNIDTFCQKWIIFGWFFHKLSLRAESNPGSANFYIFVPSLGLPKATARVGSSSSTAEKKAAQRDGGLQLIAYSIIKHLPTLQKVWPLYNVLWECSVVLHCLHISWKVAAHWVFRHFVCANFQTCISYGFWDTGIKTEEEWQRPQQPELEKWTFAISPMLMVQFKRSYNHILCWP